MQNLKILLFSVLFTFGLACMIYGISGLVYAQNTTITATVEKQCQPCLDYCIKEHCN